MSRIVARLVSDSSELLLVADGDGLPSIAHFGERLDASSSDIDPALFDRYVPGGGLDVDPRPAIIPEAARGWFGVPGLAAARAAGPLTPVFIVDSIVADDHRAQLHARDDHAGLALDLTLCLSQAGALAIDVAVNNTGADAVDIGELTVAIPVGGAAREVMTLGGRHAMEFGDVRTVWDRSTISVASRRGRTSHEQLPTVFVGEPGFGENRGEVWGVHLAWSGNHQLVCDGVTDARRTISAGPLLGVGEIRLAPGETFAAPTVVAARSSNGITGVSRAFHDHARRIRPPRRGSRPVLLNTWEAVYFRHDLPTLRSLAEVAARCGIERFVLDDGWFRGRRDDTAGLGDWHVDATVWPDGLGPIIDHVTSLGMDFGLWVEPEMVNPDSDLYRTRPEWALESPGHPRLTGRNQLVLDLGRDDVRDHLFGRLDALLSEHRIAHLKWDHNRDLVSPGSHAQTAGFYELLARLRAVHPDVDIESCASGGGRVDLGVTGHVQRFWTSDSIDALDRLAIQRGFTRVHPPEMMGAHIGSPVCHTTGRRHALAFRALSAMPGWLGVEWNLLDASDHELERLTEVISIHKQHRHLLHAGDTIRLDHPDPCIVAHGTVAQDRREALFTVARTANGPSMHTPSLKFAGLDAATHYRVSRVPLGRDIWALHRTLPEWLDTTPVISGHVLHTVGLTVPPLLPESGVLVHLDAVRRHDS